MRLLGLFQRKGAHHGGPKGLLEDPGPMMTFNNIEGYTCIDTSVSSACQVLSLTREFPPRLPLVLPFASTSAGWIQKRQARRPAVSVPPVLLSQVGMDELPSPLRRGSHCIKAYNHQLNIGYNRWGGRRKGVQAGPIESTW